MAVPLVLLISESHAGLNVCAVQKITRAHTTRSFSLKLMDAQDGICTAAHAQAVSARRDNAARRVR